MHTNDLGAHRNAGIEINNFYSNVVTRIQIIIFALPIAMQCRQRRYARSSIYCEPGLRDITTTYIVHLVHVVITVTVYILTRHSSIG